MFFKMHLEVWLLWRLWEILNSYNDQLLWNMEACNTVHFSTSHKDIRCIKMIWQIKTEIDWFWFRLFVEQTNITLTPGLEFGTAALIGALLLSLESKTSTVEGFPL